MKDGSNDWVLSDSGARKVSRNHCAGIHASFFSNKGFEIVNECAGALKLIASIEDPEVVRKILAQLNQKAGAD